MAKKRNKVPKRIAGVKVPKALRRGLKDLAATQSGKVILAELLVAIGGAVAAASPKARKAVADAGDKVSGGAQDLAAEFATAGAPLAAALDQAKRAFVDALRPAEPAASLTPATPEPTPTPPPTPH